MPDYNTQFSLFIEELVSRVGPEVAGIGIIGSQHGISNPQISDIDLLIIDKDTKKGIELFPLVRELEQKYLNTTHTKLADNIQKHLLASNDYHGVHIIHLGLDELTSDYKPKSLRLKLLSGLFISYNLFIHSLNKELHLLYGVNYLEKINLSNLTIFDRLRIISFPLTLLPLVLLLSRSRQDFIIWTIKCLKYFVESAVNYTEVSLNKQRIEVNELDIIGIERIKSILGYRYFPTEYKGNVIKLYLAVIWLIVVNIPKIILGQFNF